MTMRLSIRTDDVGCPAGTPVSLVDLDTGRRVACHASVADATHHRALLEAGECGWGDENLEVRRLGAVPMDLRGGNASVLANVAYRRGYEAAVADVNAVLAEYRARHGSDVSDYDPDEVVDPDDDDEDLEDDYCGPCGEDVSWQTPPLPYSTPFAGVVT